MPQRGSETFLPDHAWNAIIRSLGLSTREAEIARLLLADDSREDSIAAALKISRHTVHTHLERLYRKLRVSSRSQVVARLFSEYVTLADHRRTHLTPARDRRDDRAARKTR
jgi:DNA-binding CsgD family transcriptional regulator